MEAIFKEFDCCDVTFDVMTMAAILKKREDPGNEASRLVLLGLFRHNIKLQIK